MQCSFCKCGKKGQDWCSKAEEKMEKAAEEQKKRRALFAGLSWLPLSTGLLTILICVMTYVIGVLSGDIMALLPYVSDAGMTYPEGSIFSMCMNVVVTLLTTTVVVRYCLLSDCLPKLQAGPKSRRRYVRVNKSSLVIGCCSALGLAILANFPNRKNVTVVKSSAEITEDENLTVHLIGAIFCFLFGVVYSFLHSWMSFKCWSTFTSPYVCVLRLALASFSLASLVMVILFGSGLRWHATPENPVLHYRRISAAFEWILVTFLNMFFMTFWYEFRHIRLSARLHHWTGSGWETLDGGRGSLNSGSISSATPATESLTEEDMEVKLPCLGGVSMEPSGGGGGPCMGPAATPRPLGSKHTFI